MRKRNKGDIIIDLTSLLDVVFILLLVVMVQNKSSNDLGKNKIAEAERAIIEANNSKAGYDRQIKNLDKVNDYVEFIQVISKYEPDNVTKREIRVLFSAEKKEEKYTLEGQGEGVEKEFNSFEELINNYIDSNSEKVIVLSLNDDDQDILYRDKNRIEAFFNKLYVNSKNVRLIDKEK